MTGAIHIHVLTMHDRDTPPYPSEQAEYTLYMACGLTTVQGNGRIDNLDKTLHLADGSWFGDKKATCKRCLAIDTKQGRLAWYKKLGLEEKKEYTKEQQENANQKIIKALERIAKALETKVE